MNRLSIVLVIACVSYSLGAPENIESHGADINHDLEHSSEHELEKQNGYGDGNVNSDQPAPENPIQVFCQKKKKPVLPGGNGKPRNRGELCAALCRRACAFGLETSKCVNCMSGCLN
ncbi:uncharacterized protein LOC132946495 [Metopolophium dirhodum]|uniref:uncharacterized protein LOC132946495 n=1 Tax=Metopolophium dirhodum TaxID=44670 RepID=UPI00298F7310|nr:uncharacterized protein LOC132946495 [Metopolophium dirhodum]